MANGEVSPADTAFRRIRPVHVVRDPKAPGGRRASAAAFEDDSDGSSMSVYLRSLVFQLGLTEVDVVYGRPSGWAVAAIPVQTLLDEQQRIEPNPIVGSINPHPCDPAHALVHGDKAEKKRRDRIARVSALAHVVPPEGSVCGS
jgi:hypothetical protein